MTEAVTVHPLHKPPPTEGYVQWPKRKSARKKPKGRRPQKLEGLVRWDVPT